MKEILPPPPPIVRNQFETVRELFHQHVVPSYARFDIAFTRGSGSYLWDVHGKRYLDLGGGIAVCSLGHANPEITQALGDQAQRLVHVSNLYYHEPQGRLAQQIVKQLAPGKVFFCNSGAEAIEGALKLARIHTHRARAESTHEAREDAGIPDAHSLRTVRACTMPDRPGEPRAQQVQKEIL